MSRRFPPASLLVLAGLCLLALAAAPAVARVAAVARGTQEGPGMADQAVVGGCGEQPYAEVDIETRPWVWLEVTRTPEERAQGLMYREELPWDQGMLFQFGQPSRGGFWMRNTLIPLSIAWIDADGTIVDIQDMQPLTDDVHTPRAAYWYALEVNQGWFEANGVGAGQRVLLCLEASGQ